jgi:hypothetical protein
VEYSEKKNPVCTFHPKDPPRIAAGLPGKNLFQFPEMGLALSGTEQTQGVKNHRTTSKSGRQGFDF